MTKPDKAQRILHAIDSKAYPIPGCMQDDVYTVIVGELVQIEREEAQSETKDT